MFQNIVTWIQKRVKDHHLPYIEILVCKYIQIMHKVFSICHKIILLINTLHILTKCNMK